MYIDLFDPELFTPSDDDSASDRTLRLDEGLDLKFANWPPLQIDPDAESNVFGYVIRPNPTGTGMISGQPGYRLNYCDFTEPLGADGCCSLYADGQGLISRNDDKNAVPGYLQLGSYWSIGYNRQNFNIRTFERMIYLRIGDYSASWEPEYSPYTLFPIPEVTCTGGFMSVGLSCGGGHLIPAAPTQETSGNPATLYGYCGPPRASYIEFPFHPQNTTSVSIQVDRDTKLDNVRIAEFYDWYANPLYAKFNIYKMPILYTGYPNWLGEELQYLPFSGNPDKSGWQPVRDVYEPVPEMHPITIGPIECHTLSLTSPGIYPFWPMALTAKAANIIFAPFCSTEKLTPFYFALPEFPLLCSSFLEAEFEVFLPTSVIDSEIISEKLITYPNHGSFFSSDPGYPPTSTMPYIVGSTIESTLIGPYSEHSGIDRTRILDCDITSSVSLYHTTDFYSTKIENNHHMVTEFCNMENMEITAETSISKDDLPFYIDSGLLYFDTLVSIYQTTGVTTTGIIGGDFYEKTKYKVLDMEQSRNLWTSSTWWGAVTGSIPLAVRSFYNGYWDRVRYSHEYTEHSLYTYNTIINNSKLQIDSAYMYKTDIIDTDLEIETILQAEAVNINGGTSDIKMFAYRRYIPYEYILGQHLIHQSTDIEIEATVNKVYTLKPGSLSQYEIVKDLLFVEIEGSEFLVPADSDGSITDTFTPSRNNLSIQPGSEVNLFSDVVDFVPCVPTTVEGLYRYYTGGHRGATGYIRIRATDQCFHSLDINNAGTLNISSLGHVKINDNYGLINVTYIISVPTNFGTIFGNYANANINVGEISTADASVGINRGSLRGATATVYQQLLENNDDDEISAYLTITQVNKGDESLKINATFINDASNEAGAYCETAVFNDESTNKGMFKNASFYDVSSHISSITGASVSFNDKSTSVAPARFAECSLSINVGSVEGTSKNFTAEVSSSTVQVSTDHAMHPKTINGSRVVLEGGGLSTPEGYGNIIEANNGLVYIENGFGNKIVLNGGSSLAGNLANYRVASNPTGACSGPPLPWVNPQTCVPPDCINCQQAPDCWNSPDPPSISMGGDIVFNNESSNAGAINLYRSQVPEYCRKGTYYPVFTDDFLDNLVSPIFNHNSMNFGIVVKGIFNNEFINYGTTKSSTYSCSLTDMLGKSINDTYQGGSYRFYSSSEVLGATLKNCSVELIGEPGTMAIALAENSTINANRTSFVTISQTTNSSITMGGFTNRALEAALGEINGSCTVIGADNIMAGGNLEGNSTLNIGGYSRGLTKLEAGGTIGTLNIGANVSVLLKSGDVKKINNNGVLILDQEEGSPIVRSCTNKGLVLQRGHGGWCIDGGINVCFPLIKNTLPGEAPYNANGCNRCMFLADQLFNGNLMVPGDILTFLNNIFLRESVWYEGPRGITFIPGSDGYINAGYNRTKFAFGIL